MPDKTLFGLKEGILCQQVNCKGAYGAGISGAISKEFPEVEKAFRENYRNNFGRQFGTYQIIKCTDSLSVANIYSQNTYGRSGRHTDVGVLTDCIVSIAEKNPYLTVYVPYHYDRYTEKQSGIGAGFGGAEWDIIENLLRRKIEVSGIQNIVLYDTVDRHTYKI